AQGEVLGQLVLDRKLHLVDQRTGESARRNDHVRSAGRSLWNRRKDGREDRRAGGRGQELEALETLPVGSQEGEERRVLGPAAVHAAAAANDRLGLAEGIPREPHPRAEVVLVGIDPARLRYRRVALRLGHGLELVADAEIQREPRPRLEVVLEPERVVPVAILRAAAESEGVEGLIEARVVLALRALCRRLARAERERE